MRAFAYDPSIVRRYPPLVGGVIYASGLDNGPAGAELTDAFRAEQQTVRDRIGGAPLSELPTLAAWRRVFRSFGVDPTKYRSAAEALLRRLTKQGELPSINALVDVANLVSIRYALPVAAFDLRAVAGGIDVRLARGDEPWSDLGSSETEHPEPGEVIFADEVDTAIARRWCWRQSAATAADEQSREVLVTIEGHHDAAYEDIAAALGDLQALLERHVRPARLERAFVSADRPRFERQQP